MEEDPPPPTQESSSFSPYNYIISCIRSIYRTSIISATWLLVPDGYCIIPSLFLSFGYYSLFSWNWSCFYVCLVLLGFVFPVLNMASVAYIQCLSKSGRHFHQLPCVCNSIAGGLQGNLQRSVNSLGPGQAKDLTSDKHECQFRHACSGHSRFSSHTFQNDIKGTSF